MKNSGERKRKVNRPVLYEAALTPEPPARGGGGLLLRGSPSPKVFDLLLRAPKHGSILSRFEGAWWRLLADGRFFFEPARLNDYLSNAHILQGTYEERQGSYLLQAESYRDPPNLLALEALIRPGKGQYVLGCLFLDEGSDSPILQLTQSLTTEDRRGLPDGSQVIKGVPAPALYDLELSGETTSGSFSALQACLYTAASPGVEGAGGADDVRFGIHNGSTPRAAAEQNGTCSLLMPLNTFMDAASGFLPARWRFDLAVADARIRLNAEDIPASQPLFNWYEIEAAPAVAGVRPFLSSCSARSVTLDCRVSGDTVSGEIRALGATYDGRPARYEATIKGRRAPDVPQTLAQLEQKVSFHNQERDWRDRNIFDGEWRGQRFSQLRLCQNGPTVTGTFYGQTNGSVAGTATEHRMTLDWADESDAGRGVLHAVRGGQFLAGLFLPPDDSAPAAELLFRSGPSSRLVEDTLSEGPRPLEWNRKAAVLKSLNRLVEASLLYEKVYKACGAERRRRPPHTEAWNLLLSQEWGALLDFMNCCQMRNLFARMSVHPLYMVEAEKDEAAFAGLLHAFEHATRLQAELYAAAQKAEAEEGVRFPDFGARLSQQIEFWRRSLSDEAGRMDALEASQSRLAALLKVLVSAGNFEQALVVAENARARAFSDLMQNRIYREQARAALPALSPEEAEDFLAQTIAATAPVELEMLVQTARHQQSTIVEYFLGEDELFAWVISASGKIDLHQHRQSNLSKILTDLVASTRSSLGVQTREAVRKNAAQPAERFLPRLTELYRLLVEPVARWLPKDELEAVIFIPHGALFLVPFPALFDRQQYLIERHTISVAPSIRFVETTYQLAATRETHPPGLLVVGDPLMPTMRRDGRRPGERLPQLEFARREAEQIARKLKSAAVLGADASKEHVLKLLPQQRLVHLATHGLLEDAEGTAEMPGAIALAPANGDDGFLTARQIAALDLQARLVVMSACNTGRGRLSADGILGLLRAFLTAGAECVVASLWAVADRSTQELMVEFYDGLLRGQPIALALRQAMLKLKDDRRYGNPLYWAAFAVSGHSHSPLFETVGGADDLTHYGPKLS